MLNTLKDIVKHSFIYGLGSLLSKFLGVILLPIYTRFLTPADYGILSLLVITGSITGIIVKLGLNSALFREIIYHESEKAKALSTTLYFLILESAIFFGILVFFSSSISKLIFRSIEQSELLKFIFITRFLDTFRIIAMTKLRIGNRSKAYATLSVINFLIGVLLNIYFIVILRRGVEGLVIAGLIGSSFFTIISLFIMWNNLKVSFSPQILKRMLRFGVPLVPVGLSSYLMTSADRYFLQHFSTTTEVGLYSIGYKIGLIMSLIVQSFQLAWPSKKFEIAKQPNAESNLSKILTYYLFSMGFIGLAISLFSREILFIMTTPEFYKAYIVVPLIVLSYIFYGMRFITNIALAVQNKMKYVPPIIIGSAGLNLYFNYLLIPRYGMMGAAIATIISYLVLVIVQTVVNLHFWYIPYEYKRLLKIIIIWIGTYGIGFIIELPTIWLNLTFKLVLLLLFPLILYFLHFFEPQEIKAIKKIVNSELNRFLPWRTR